MVRSLSSRSRSMGAHSTGLPCSITRPEFAGECCGVKGRFHNVVSDEKRIRNQKFTSQQRKIEGGRISVKIRFDDELNNGHESFSITADIRYKDGGEAGGCCHDDIVKVFPEFTELIQWHLCSTDGPMHYIANTLYHAGNCDHWGLLKGEPSKNPNHLEHFVRFGNSPIEHPVKKRLKKFIDDTLSCDGEFILDRVDHPKDVKTYGSKYQFAGMECKWYECPFDEEIECRQWIDAITSTEMVWVQRSTVFGEGEERQLDFARSSAVWLDATDEQLCSEPEVLKAMLLERLPALLDRFFAAMEKCGFVVPTRTTEGKVNQ